MTKAERKEIFKQIHEADLQCDEFPVQDAIRPRTRDFWEGVHEGLYYFMKAFGYEEEYWDYLIDLEGEED